ncbi:acyl-CoA N-acyltransferase [Aspergillus pseudonomiae]|uniref:Acyl-CoA N-acyltransferase n=1 Tax=Aspergillus pseudonomiae TaxID=1506151 RepID=A0A5N7CSZ3_9EURO|nr:acyl-CoA N-acyltransferase [Aspergillus pseudonomiae]KAE8397069.1 acyl-CoA N-acyltransferase [Aspergillus pseudonomiae]
MSFEIRYATESDAPSLAEINIASFSHQPLWSNVSPSLEASVVFPYKLARCLERIRHSDAHILVAVDVSQPSEKVVGYASWSVPSVLPLPQSHRRRIELGEGGTATTESIEQLRPEGMQCGIYENIINMLKEEMGRCAGPTDITLDYLATLPEYQGQGVGSSLLRWGIKLVQELKQRILLVATTDGYPLYSKLGWRVLREIVVDYRELGGHGEQIFTLMVWDYCCATELS